MSCVLCDDPADQRLSGHDVCAPCVSRDPTEGLSRHGIPVEFSRALGAFHAGAGIPGAPEGFRIRCVPEMLSHKVMKLFTDEVEVGDPTFDSAVYVRTSDPDTARGVLAGEGVQTALLALLSDVRRNDLRPTHVTLEGPTLTIRVVPMKAMLTSEATYRAYELETAALALHLKELFA